MNVEAQSCGTPVWHSDWGGLPRKPVFARDYRLPVPGFWGVLLGGENIHRSGFGGLPGMGRRKRYSLERSGAYVWRVFSTDRPISSAGVGMSLMTNAGIGMDYMPDIIPNHERSKASRFCRRRQEFFIWRFAEKCDKRYLFRQITIFYGLNLLKNDIFKIWQITW